MPHKFPGLVLGELGLKKTQDGLPREVIVRHVIPPQGQSKTHQTFIK
jgi:hypothetical protein